MKKLLSFIITALLSFLIQAQDRKIQTIDSLVKTFKTDKMILLFSELQDTLDSFTGKKYIQKKSYYFDWVNKELRFVDVYYLESKKKHYSGKIFTKRKNIPLQTRILYTFLKNQLVHVKLTPSKNQCVLCFGEYFYSDNKLICANEVNLHQQKKNFICDAAFFLERLEIDTLSSKAQVTKPCYIFFTKMDLLSNRNWKVNLPCREYHNRNNERHRNNT